MADLTKKSEIEQHDDWWGLMMAGGASSRFFPLNKILFDPVGIGRTLSQQAFDRLCHKESEDDTTSLNPSNFIIVTSKLFSETLSNHIPEIPKSNFIGEPAPRSTMPAILLGMSHIRNVDTNAVMCIVTADHIISDVRMFRATLETARQVAVQRDCIVTIGITPSDMPQDWIGFGAIHSEFDRPIAVENQIHSECSVYPLIRFEEKPSVPRAQQMIDENRIAAQSNQTQQKQEKEQEQQSSSERKETSSSPLAWTWNAGMFVFRVQTMELALQAFHPEIYAIYLDLCKARSEEERNKAFLRFPNKIQNPLNPNTQVDCSIDYCIMMPLTDRTSHTASITQTKELSESKSETETKSKEQDKQQQQQKQQSTNSIDNLSAAVIPGNFPWFDVGGWSAFRNVKSIIQDSNGNILIGNSECINQTKRSIIVCEKLESNEKEKSICSKDNKLIADNLNDYVAVLTKDGTLALIPDSISPRLKDLKSIADKPENDKTHVLTECKNVEIVELGKEGRLRVCGLGVSDIRVIVECVEPLVVVLQNIGQK
ncbi:MAG: mannose-1-phosphate guanylyltransferase/mannose-6-phosphate isomerase [Streblomastix strix]|uniref:Mannose-1-phosphate guanylyltransferase/mannose-6-phosphate isomerase n=1 Tax=Streblomastix strix TaxID=222440 RepID=A0A5J4W3Q0_9EUKA|nr:MAG: mannose-1-phosphate guanylyltransferase/mannose-6-phosphate isomerase [Streblomastix strix]